MYEGSVADIPVRIIHLFLDDRLARAKYLIDRTNDDQYLRDFFQLEQLLRKKYGDPRVEDLWADAERQSHARDLMLSVSNGALAMFRTWPMENADVTLGLMAVDYEVELAIEYSHHELSSMEHERRENDLLDEL